MDDEYRYRGMHIQNVNQIKSIIVRMRAWALVFFARRFAS